jgi:hypothetical protein
VVSAPLQENMRRGAWSLRLNGCGTAATWRPVADITRAAAAASNNHLAVLTADQSKLATKKSTFRALVRRN